MMTDERASEEAARRICNFGDYFELLSEIKERNLFESQKRRIERLYGDRLRNIPFLSKDDQEMLTILELYDTGTFEHSLHVFETIFEKLESRREIGVFLRDHITREGISRNDLLRAALLHDIGKVTIPKEVLRDTTSDEEWMMLAKVILDPRGYETVERIMEQNPRLRGKDLIPFSFAIPPALAESLRDRGIDPDQPLGVIVGKHAVRSGETLRAYGFPVAAEIAESHHDRPMSEEPRRVSVSSLRIAKILRLADIFCAIRDPKRTYRSGSPLETALFVIEKEAALGALDQKTTDIWVADELREDERG